MNFVDIAERAGLTAKTEDGDDKTKRYIIETTGSGAAAFDFDNDGWPDIYVACDSTPSLLFHDNHNGTFTETAAEAGVALHCSRDPQRLLAEYHARGLDGVAPDIHQPSAAERQYVAHVCGVGVEIAERADGAAQLPDAPSAHQFHHADPLRVRLHHEGFADDHARAVAHGH